MPTCICLHMFSIWRRQQDILGWLSGQASAYTTALYGYTLTGAPALQHPTPSPHAGVLETTLSRLSWQIFMEAGTGHCA